MVGCAWALSAACVSLACSGFIQGEDVGDSRRGDGSASGGSGAGSGTPGAGTPSTVPTANPDGSAVEGSTVGQMPLRRLGKHELENTLRDLLPALPADLAASADLPADNGIELAFAIPGTVSDLEVNRFMELAESAIEALGASLPGASFDCAGADETSCARAFVESFGKRAFRRPLDSAEVDDLMALYDTLRTDADMLYDFQGALAVLVEAMLQSPGFLYRWERGLQAPQLDGELIKLDHYEVASRLSYYLWNSMPDDALFAAADAGALATPDQVAEQAARLLADARADDALGDFVMQWLELGYLPALVKDTNVYPEFTPELRASMQAETLAFTRDVVRGAEPTLTSLLTANYSYADGALASYYGLTPDESGRVDLSGSSRLGILTQASLLSVKGNSYRTSPVRRGKFVLNRLLCESVPPPPPDVVPDLPPPDPSLTQREQMAAHRENPACAGCHTKMDALGFAFEYFDGAGKVRADDLGHPIDASGTASLDGADVSFSNATELVMALAASPTVHQCFARQWLRYAIDRFEQDADGAAVSYLGTKFEESALDARSLLVEITRTLPFSHRAPAEGEVLTP
jgi:hypothetical protein